MLFYLFIIAGLICGFLDLLLYSRNIIVLILSIAFLISIPVIISLYPRDEEKRSRNAAVVITTVVFAICRLILNSISLEIDFNMSYMKDYTWWMDLVGVIFAACAVYIISIRVLADKSDKVRSLKRRIITFTTFAAIFLGMCVWAGVLNMQETKEKKEAEYQYTPAPPKSANTSATAPSKPTNTPAPAPSKTKAASVPNPSNSEMFDPSDHDIEQYNYDNQDDFEDEDEAAEGYEDDGDWEE